MDRKVKGMHLHVLCGLHSLTLCQCFRDVRRFRFIFFFFSSRRRHTRFDCDWSSECALPILADADAGLALVHLRDAQTLYQLGDAVSGVRLRLDDLFAARSVARELMARLPQNVFASDWTRSHANFFRAVEIEKRMMFIILTLIILVAAINIISTLVVAVTDKQADIAILRTLGAAPGSVMQIFIVQGMVIGIVGTLIGAGLGIVTALNIDVIVPAIESAFNIKFLSKDVYLIPELPSDLQAGDVGAIVLMALALSFFATLYPSWPAARLNPAEALRYE